MKALFFDLDGTLYIDGKISEKTRQALLSAKNAGVLLFLNTGRSYGFLPPDVRSDGIFDGMICGCSYVRVGETVVENLTLPRATLEDVYNFAKEKKICTVFEGVEESYSLFGREKDASALFSTTVLPQISKVTFWCDPKLIHEEDFPNLRIVHFRTYAEGLLPGRDKSTGMRILLERFGLSRFDICAFGDSENDEDMLRFAGSAVAMPSAPACFDAFCAYRAKERDGVPEGISWWMEKMK